MSFTEMGLLPELLSAIETQGYTTATPVQQKAIPEVLAGRDVLAGAQTGTGKTAAFTLPMLQKLFGGDSHPCHNPRALILTPTRELAGQVGESVENYGAELKVRSTTIFGGVRIGPQLSAIKKGLDVVIATPGRLLDHMQQKNIDLSHVEILILDEADRMLDMGFIHDIRKVIKALPSQRQTLFFSATYSNEVKKLADGLLHKPVEVEVAKRNATAENVMQQAYACGQSRKADLLAALLKQEEWYQVIVFTRTKHGANKLAGKLAKSEFPSAAIHGNKSQAARTRALKEFKDGKIQVLVATDIAARGLDIQDLPCVVNFELPNVPEDYVHRIGRTGRAGAKGIAISFVSSEEKPYLRSIEHLLKTQIPLEVLEEYKDKQSKKVVRGRASRYEEKHAETTHSKAARKEGQKNRRPGGPRQGGGNKGNGPKRQEQASHGSKPGAQSKARKAGQSRRRNSNNSNNS